MPGPWQSAFESLRDLLGLRAIASPYVPEGQFLLYGAPATRWDGPALTITESLWPAPPVHADWKRIMAGEPELFPRRVYLEERAKALDHLAGLLDDACDELGFDREVWRGPRRDERRLFWERQQVALRAEARVAFSIMRPETLVKVVLP